MARKAKKKPSRAAARTAGNNEVRIVQVSRATVTQPKPIRAASAVAAGRRAAKIRAAAAVNDTRKPITEQGALLQALERQELKPTHEMTIEHARPAAGRRGAAKRGGAPSVEVAIEVG